MLHRAKDVFPSMTVEENLLLGAYTIKDKAKTKDNIEMVLESMPRLKDKFKSASRSSVGRRTADVKYRTWIDV